MSHYPDGTDGWVEKCAAAGIDIEQSTSEFLAQIRGSRSRTRAGRELFQAVLGAPVLSEAEIDRWENRFHVKGVRHGRKAA